VSCSLISSKRHYLYRLHSLRLHATVGWPKGSATKEAGFQHELRPYGWKEGDESRAGLYLWRSSIATQLAQSCFSFDPFGFPASLNINLSRAVTTHLTRQLPGECRAATPFRPTPFG
jgi:hypothetical protein